MDEIEVNVSWRQIALFEQVTLQEPDDAGALLATDRPMPVGTRVLLTTLEDPPRRWTARVTTVVEARAPHADEEGPVVPGMRLAFETPVELAEPAPDLDGGDRTEPGATEPDATEPPGERAGVADTAELTAADADEEVHELTVRKQPEPAAADEPVRDDDDTGDPTDGEPQQAAFAAGDPAQDEPAHDEPAHDEPAHDEPADAAPGDPELYHDDETTPAPTYSALSPSVSGEIQLSAVEPDATDPGDEEPAPVDDPDAPDKVIVEVHDPPVQAAAADDAADGSASPQQPEASGQADDADSDTNNGTNKKRKRRRRKKKRR